MRYLAWVFGVLVVSVYCQVDDLPTTETFYANISQGIVVGSIAESSNYLEFHGIPYADSTSGVYRFKAPRPAPSFVDVFFANRKDVKCVHPLGIGYAGTEDCLVADVFTPTLDNTRRLPVMVWVKGTEFDQAKGPELSFENIVEQDVVVVTLNYRESILGYLCLGTEDAPGNAGLKDIIAGLRWVQENIQQFGGDPESITLFGHGSGAAAVDLVTLSPLSNNLVHKAISQSGSAIAPWAVTRDNLEYAVIVAEALGHVVTDVEALSEIFSRTSVAALMAVINELELTDNSLAFSPCIEKDNLEGESFLVKSPFQILTEGDFVPIPFMTGFVDREGTIRAAEAIEDSWLQRMQTSFLDFIQPDLQFVNQTQKYQVATEIKNFYFADGAIDLNNFEDYISYHGDTMILVSALREAEIRAAVSNGSVYVYQFSYKGSLGQSFVGSLGVDGAAHSEDLAYLFNDIISTTVPTVDLVISDILIERWTNFAKTGEPTSTTSQIVWRPFTETNSNYIRILNDDEIKALNGTSLEIDLENPHPTTVSFWTEIYNNYFKDAAGRWNLDSRDEGEDLVDPNPVDPDTVDPDDGDDDNDDNDDDDDDDDDDSSSATATVGLTFLIGSLALLNILHLLYI